MMFEGLDAYKLLDARSGFFDKNWMLSFGEIESAWRQFRDSVRNEPAMVKLREAAYIRAFSASGGNPDLAATVSDDFEIICKRTLLGLDMPFVAWLEEVYEAQRIPEMNA